MKSRIILGVYLLFAHFQTHSADFTVDGGKILIEGDITVGDFEKLRKITDDHPVLPGMLELASPGGNVAEAINMGRLVRRLRMSTSAPLTSGVWAESAKLLAQRAGIKDVERNNTCASACFFIYVAGVDRMGDTIGIHQPYFDPEMLRKSEGSDVIERSRGVKLFVESYLSEMGVPSKYTELMFNTRKNEIRWLTHDEISHDFLGLIPELRDWVESRCGIRPPSKAPYEESKKWFDCRSDSLQQMRYDALFQIYRKKKSDLPQ